MEHLRTKTALSRPVWRHWGRTGEVPSRAFVDIVFAGAIRLPQSDADVKIFINPL